MRYFSLLLLATACAIQPQVQPVLQYSEAQPKEAVVLARDEEDRSIFEEPEISYDERVLDQAMGAHLDKQEECPEDPGELDEAFESGYFVPKIVSKIMGSFSRPRSSQEIFIIAVGECGATHSDHWGTRRLILVEDGKVLINSKFFWDSAENPMDLDNDGYDEWFSTSVFCNQGSCTEEAAVTKIINSDLQAILDLGTIFESNCEAPGGTNSKKWAQVVSKDGHLHKSWQETKCL